MKTKRVKEKYSSSNNFSPTKPIQESVCVYVWMNWVVFNEKKIQTLQSCWLIGSQTDERMDRRQIRRYIDTTIGTSTTNNREWWRGIWRNNQRKTKYHKKENNNNNNTNLIKRKEKHCSHTCVEAATEAITKLRHHHQRHPAVMSSLRTEGRCLGLPRCRGSFCGLNELEFFFDTNRQEKTMITNAKNNKRTNRPTKQASNNTKHNFAPTNAINGNSDRATTAAFEWNMATQRQCWLLTLRRCCHPNTKVLTNNKSWSWSCCSSHMNMYVVWRQRRRRHSWSSAQSESSYKN